MRRYQKTIWQVKTESVIFKRNLIRYAIVKSEFFAVIFIGLICLKFLYVTKKHLLSTLLYNEKMRFSMTYRLDISLARYASDK